MNARYLCAKIFPKIENEHYKPQDFRTIFTTLLIKGVAVHDVSSKCTVLNLSEEPIQIEQEKLGHVQLVVITHTALRGVAYAVIIERFVDRDNEAELLVEVKELWPSAFDVRGEERPRALELCISTKVWLGKFGFTMYHAVNVALNEGFHRDHAFRLVSGVLEVHTQIVGFGKMQRFCEREVNIIYIEEHVARRTSHCPV